MPDIEMTAHEKDIQSEKEFLAKIEKYLERLPETARITSELRILVNEYAVYLQKLVQSRIELDFYTYLTLADPSSKETSAFFTQVKQNNPKIRKRMIIIREHIVKYVENNE